MAFSNHIINIKYCNKIRRIVIIPFLVATLLLAYITPCSENYDSFLYFFSTNAQVLAAIVALMGTYLIFRVNLIDLKLDSLTKHISAVIEKVIKELYSPLAIRRIEKEEFLKKFPENNRNSINQLFEEYEEIKKVRENTIEMSKFPVIFASFIIFSSIIFIYIIPLFYHHFIGRFSIYMEASMSLWAIVECVFLLNLVMRINPLS